MSTLPPEYDTSDDRRQYKLEPATPTFAEKRIIAWEKDDEIVPHRVASSRGLAAYSMASGQGREEFTVVGKDYVGDLGLWCILERAYQSRGADIVLRESGSGYIAHVQDALADWRKVPGEPCGRKDALVLGMWAIYGEGKPPRLRGGRRRGRTLEEFVAEAQAVVAARKAATAGY